MADNLLYHASNGHLMFGADSGHLLYHTAPQSRDWEITPKRLSAKTDTLYPESSPYFLASYWAESAWSRNVVEQEAYSEDVTDIYTGDRTYTVTTSTYGTIRQYYKQEATTQEGNLYHYNVYLYNMTAGFLLLKPNDWAYAKSKILAEGYTRITQIKIRSISMRRYGSVFPSTYLDIALLPMDSILSAGKTFTYDEINQNKVVSYPVSGGTILQKSVDIPCDIPIAQYADIVVAAYWRDQDVISLSGNARVEFDNGLNPKHFIFTVM